jgi:hypothetical protein
METVIEKIEKAVEVYNAGNVSEDVFKIAREAADKVIEEQPDFIHFVIDEIEYEIVHTQITTYPNHKMNFGEYEAEEPEELIFEVCSNAEWIEQNLKCPENPDSNEIGCIIDAETEKFTKLCEEAGLGIPQFTSPKGQRILYHGWNGAGFRYKNGIFGTFNELTPDQIKILDKY